MAKMPAMLDAQKQLEKLSGTYDDYKKNGWRIQKIKKYEAESATVTDVNGDRSKEVQDMQKRIVDLEIMLKRITTKRIWYCKSINGKSKNFNPLEKQRFPICIRRFNSLLADGPNLTADVKRFRFLENQKSI
jgi:outer membrane protein